MNELINSVAEKAGISTEQATAAVQTVVKYLKGVLPSGLGDHLDRFLPEGAESESAEKKDDEDGGLGGVVKKLGGLFGK